MAKAKQNNLVMYRNFAQFVTVGAAVLYGLLWVVDGLMNSESVSIDKLGNILIALTVVGGIAMGLLYAIDPAKKK